MCDFPIRRRTFFLMSFLFTWKAQTGAIEDSALFHSRQKGTSEERRENMRMCILLTGWEEKLWLCSRVISIVQCSSGSTGHEYDHLPIPSLGNHPGLL